MKKEPSFSRFTRRVNRASQLCFHFNCENPSSSIALRIFLSSEIELLLTHQNRPIDGRRVTFRAILRNKYNPLVDAINELKDHCK